MSLDHLRGLEAHLRAHLRGQDAVIRQAAAVFHRGEMGLAGRGRPRGAFLAVGPTGTGKTELALLAGRYLFGDSALRRIDLSEFQRADAVERFLGAGREDGGALGRLEYGKSPRLWLFDELEKAHPKLLDLFIQMLEPGKVTLASGAAVEFEGDYVAFTSNLGASEGIRMSRSSLASVEQAVLRRVAESLRPELLARIPEKLVFARLPDDVQREITGLHLDRELERLRSVGFDLRVSGEVVEFLVREGFHPQLGARILRQTVERQVQDAVVEAIFACGARRGTLTVAAGGTRLRLNP